MNMQLSSAVSTDVSKTRSMELIMCAVKEEAQL